MKDLSISNIATIDGARRKLSMVKVEVAGGEQRMLRAGVFSEAAVGEVEVEQCEGEGAKI